MFEPAAADIGFERPHRCHRLGIRLPVLDRRLHRSSCVRAPPRVLRAGRLDRFGARRSIGKSGKTLWGNHVRGNPDLRWCQNRSPGQRERRAAVRDLYENAPCGYHSVGSDGTILRMNRTELRWLGFTRRELVGARAFVTTLHPRCTRRYLRAFGTLLDGAARAELQAEFVRKDGSVFPASLGISAVRDRTGAFVATQGSVLDLSARRRAEEDARRYAARLRTMSRRLLEAQEGERRRLSAELHDRIGQDLAAANLDLHLLKDELPPSLRARVGARLDDAIARIEATADSVRDVAGALRPPVLDAYGLVVSLRTCAEQFVARTGIPIVVDARWSGARADAAVETALFRICQEALTNVMRHAGARAVRIVLGRSDGAGCLSIADDGCGFDAAEIDSADHEALGILGMRERMLAVGGELLVESAPGHGTRVIARVPLC
ncbi:MAG TPA: ATP-binding protein [Zeimonas sp.]